MALKVPHAYRVDIAAGTTRKRLDAPLMYGDANTHRFTATVMDGGDAADLTGYTGILYAVRADGVTIPNEATIAGNVVTADLAQSGLLARGRVDLLLTLSGGGESLTPLWVEATCAGGITDTIADPAEIIPSLSDLLAQIAAMAAGVTAANTAAGAANTAASAANAAATEAQDAANAVADMTAEAGTLETGEPAQAFLETDPEDGHLNLVLGLPKGDTGDRGSLMYRGTAITGTSMVPTAYATGIAAAQALDLYRYNGTDAANVGNVYECTQGGNAATALWVYAGNWRGAAGAGNVSFVDGMEADVNGDVPLAAVRYGAQALTAAQQAQGRTNLGAQARVDAVGLLKGTGIGGVLAAVPGQDYAKATRLTATLPAAGWTGTGPYMQTVSVAEMLATDTPTVDVVLSDVTATAQAQLEAYGLIGRAVTGEDAITVTCYEEAPTVDLTLSLQVVRGNTVGEAGTDLTADMVETSEAGVSVQAKLDAVDIAMAGKADRTGVMRLLISRTIQAGENVAAITWTQDDAGNALTLAEAELRIWVPANSLPVGSSGYINGRINGLTTGYYGSTSDDTNTLEIGVLRAAFGTELTVLKRTGSQLQCVNWYRYSDGTTRSAGTRVSGSTAAVSTITSIYLWITGTGLTGFPEGTILEVYGRNAA